MRMVPYTGVPIQFTLSMSAEMGASTDYSYSGIWFALNATPVVNHALDVHVSISPPVRGLSWNTTEHRQEAAFGLTATVDQPVQPGFTRTYNWTGTGLTFDDPHAASTTVHTYDEPGQFFATCEVVDTASTETVYSGSDSKACFAIGGPVTVQRRSGVEATFANDGNDATRSVYLTYYNYSHAGGPLSRSFQPTQDATATVKPQPAGTTVTWTIDPVLYSGTLVSDPHALTISLQAESEFQNCPIRAHFSFVHPFDPSVTGATDDDSPTTQFLHGSPATWVNLVYTVSAHKPGRFGAENPVAWTIAHNQGQDWASIKYEYRLLDTIGEPMPGVWVQERFTDNNPWGLTTNKETGVVWKTVLASITPDTAIGDGDGWWRWDFLGYRWPPGDRAARTTIHEYWAGTSDFNVGGAGVRIGEWTISFTVGQNVGDQGTASQTKTGQ